MNEVNNIYLTCHDLIKPRNFSCVAAVSRGFSSVTAEFTKFSRSLSNFAAENCGLYWWHLSDKEHTIRVTANEFEKSSSH